MSTTSNVVIATFESFLLNTRITTAITALVCFEHLITFKYEIYFLWRRKWNATTWIFVTNRYFLLANVLFLVAPTVPKICNDPRAMSTLDFISVGELSTIPTHAFGILRIFALLQDHSWRLPVTWALSALTLTEVILTSYLQFQAIWIYVDDPILGPICGTNGYSVPMTVVNCVSKAAAVIGIISALFTLAITLMKTARQVQQASTLGLKTTLSEVLLRDGSVFFLMVLVRDLVETVLTADESLYNENAGSILTTLFFVLPQISLSRFIINLRQTDSPGNGTSANQRLSRFSMPNFRMPTMSEVIGNAGEPLDFVEHHLDEEDSAQDGDTTASGDTALHNSAAASGTTGVMDIEAAGSSGSVGVGVPDISGIEL